MQTTKYLDNNIILFTTLYHTSGQYIISEYPVIPVQKNNPQHYGSALTYAKRYSFSALLGLASESEDDDGNIETLMVKFDRQALAALLAAGNTYILTVSGELSTGESFEGTDEVRTK